MQTNGYTILDRLATASYADAPTLAGHDPRENLLLRMYHALEAAGLTDDNVTADRDEDGHCTNCHSPRGVAHTDRCPVPRCVITGEQRLCCRQRGQDGHDCGTSLWADQGD